MQSLSIFVRAWTTTARGESDLVVSPEFAATKLYPPANEAFNVPAEDQAGKRKRFTKRFVFLASKVKELKKIASSADAVSSPTGVQSVTFLIWRCVVPASSDNIREKMLSEPANLRSKRPSLCQKT